MVGRFRLILCLGALRARSFRFLSIFQKLANGFVCKKPISTSPSSQRWDRLKLARIPIQQTPITFFIIFYYFMFVSFCIFIQRIHLYSNTMLKFFFCLLGWFFLNTYKSIAKNCNSFCFYAYNHTPLESLSKYLTFCEAEIKISVTEKWTKKLQYRWGTSLQLIASEAARYPESCFPNNNFEMNFFRFFLFPKSRYLNYHFPEIAILEDIWYG